MVNGNPDENNWSVLINLKSNLEHSGNPERGTREATQKLRFSSKRSQEKIFIKNKMHKKTRFPT